VDSKISNITDLAKFSVAKVVFRVVFRPIGSPSQVIPDDDQWMLNAHPQVLFDYGIIKDAWTFLEQTPRLCAADFKAVVDLLTSEPIVEKFVISEVRRSPDTGEFYYGSASGDWMPERCVWASYAEAVAEKFRVKRLFSIWASRHSADEVRDAI
jgi:hypothetical protein